MAPEGRPRGKRFAVETAKRVAWVERTHRGYRRICGTMMGTPRFTHPAKLNRRRRGRSLQIVLLLLLALAQALRD